MAQFRIREMAQERGLTADDLARISGVKFSTVRNIWQGRTNNPAYNTLSAIAKALGTTIEDLVVEETEDNRGALPMAA